ncbi:alpha/beta hydrolase [Polycladidibacter stylochi]|uniref:alpha/beta hydrolase n=1 Tax=Polycladidibacter stylochi TaxID=1807766 RepID=UPI0008298D04|nr:alpha/beta fold hydrolase [Pseudovibrio stylochi]
MKKLFLILASVSAIYLYFDQPLRTNEPAYLKPPQVTGTTTQYLAQSEAKFSDIRSGLDKQVIWADAPEQKTNLALVYLHGFSASKEEIRPYPDLLAKHYQANLFYQRLSGHGRGGAAMGKATAEQWMHDTLEALEIGNRIGNKTVLIATSTGGTLAAWAALTGKLKKSNVVAIVFVSPNFAIKAAGSSLLTRPITRDALPFILGSKRNTDTKQSPEKQHGWTMNYPFSAVFPMAELVAYVQTLAFEKAQVPALFIYSPQDKTVDAAATDLAYETWGAAKERILVTNSSDENNHLIMGKVSSPNTTIPLSKRTIDWLGKILQ